MPPLESLLHLFTTLGCDCIGEGAWLDTKTRRTLSEVFHPITLALAALDISVRRYIPHEFMLRAGWSHRDVLNGRQGTRDSRAFGSFVQELIETAPRLEGQEGCADGSVNQVCYIEGRRSIKSLLHDTQIQASQGSIVAIRYIVRI